jgi:DNA primase
MFPIRDVSGRVVAFGGRALGEAGPKYLNSPDTPIYKKGNHLYGLDAAKEVIRRKDFAILVEGYFDCIVPAQCGFANVVASLGTGLTENQVRLLGRYSRNVVISFDPDSAGMAAALRSIDLFLGQGFRVNVVLLPSGHDPDTFLREFGAEAYAARLKSSIPFLDFALSRFLDQQPDPFSPRGKQETVTQILPYLMKAPSSIERAEYVARIAERLQIDEELVRAELRRMTGKGQAAQTERRGLLEQTLPAENSLLAAALDPEWRGFTLPLLRLTLFEGLNSAPVFQKLEELRKLDRDINILNLRKLLPEGEVLELVEAIAVRASDLPLSEEIIRGSVEALQARCLRLDNSRRQEAIRREQALDPDSARLRELVREKEQRLREQRKSGLI